MLGRDLLRSGNAGVPNVSHYDLVLAVVPLPLLVGLFAGAVLPVTTQTGVSAGALLSALTVGHLLFRDPPTRRGPGGDESVGGDRVGTTSVGSGSVGESSA
ncbi:hypothetical protein M0R89_04245 [Halorussus limi]|uniref:Uncharacterized protein n=1 Tax=Halorussus limi TaxID=2938695 RepID=A0A8U0HW16_9EURY|nr:hypothetical protein [Halorussus limi]UPV75282.1 hypothetical protein M0R89_04245 [Halorussus limi]